MYRVLCFYFCSFRSIIYFGWVNIVFIIVYAIFAIIGCENFLFNIVTDLYLVYDEDKKYKIGDTDDLVLYAKM